MKVKDLLNEVNVPISSGVNNKTKEQLEKEIQELSKRKEEMVKELAQIDNKIDNRKKALQTK